MCGLPLSVIVQDKLRGLREANADATNQVITCLLTQVP
jgi:hypothetical protein